jgi:hypothetical protein
MWSWLLVFRKQQKDNGGDNETHQYRQIFRLVHPGSYTSNTNAMTVLGVAIPLLGKAVAPVDNVEIHGWTNRKVRRGGKA